MKQGVSYALLVTAVLLCFVGCGRVVPPGTTVVILKAKGAPVVKTEGVYIAWGRDRVYFVDTKLKAYSKDLQILCADDINMDVTVKWVGSFRVSDDTIDVIKAKVPSESIPKESDSAKQTRRLSLDKFFATTMEDILSSITRGVISAYKTDNIREQREAIRQEIKTQFLARLGELHYPVETADVLITNLDYPINITKKRQAIKSAELQDLENAAIARAEVAKARRDAELALEKGKAALVKAQADAAANDVRAKSLTPEILAVKQLETLVRLAEGPNNTVVVIPFDAIRPGGMQDMLIQRDAITRLVSETGETGEKAKKK